MCSIGEGVDNRGIWHLSMGVKEAKHGVPVLGLMLIGESNTKDLAVTVTLQRFWRMFPSIGWLRFSYCCR